MKKIFLSLIVLISFAASAQTKDHNGKYRFDSLYATLSQKGLDTTNFKIVVQRLSDGKFFKMYWPASGSSGVQTLSSQYTDASNSGTTETDLMSYTLPAGKLANNGDRIEIEGFFVYSAVNTKTLRLYFGSNSAAAISTGFGAASGVVKFRATIIRTGTAAERVSYTFEPTTGSPVRATNDITTTLSSSALIKFTGQSDAASNDVTQKIMTVTYYPAP